MSERVVIRIGAKGNVVLPTDLVAPLGGEDCCGQVWLAPIADVVRASVGSVPLVTPCCGRRFGVRHLGDVAFVSKAEWESTSDEDETACPETYYVGHAFRRPDLPSGSAQ